MGQALYRKYRSKSLDEIVGQSHITDMLRRAIASGNVAHAYLLTGPRGVGKTSIARILAHEINDLPYTDESTHLDIIEIDAASNNSVEDIRDLREKVMIAPAQAKKKIYIIDEVHMLSKSAFNALLKTLEEPPEHAVFILATTDAEKLPATIISRVQRFNFRAITPNDAAAHLRTIADAENITIDDDALMLIAQHGKGSFRDSIGLLDQLRNISDGAITRELIESVLGLAETETIAQILQAYETHDIATILTLVDTAEARGTPAGVLTEQLIHAIRPQIATRPELIKLLDNLLDTARSNWPHVKLLTALTRDAAAHVQPSAQPAKKISAEQKTAAPTTPIEPKVAAKHPRPEKPAAAPKPAKQPSVSAVEFPWTDFLEAVKTTSAGAFALLQKCGYKFDDAKLTIFAGKKFTRARLEKSISELSAALQTVGIADGTIEISESAAPPKDSQTAAVFDIMGGGEEVSL